VVGGRGVSVVLVLLFVWSFVWLVFGVVW